MSERNDLSKEYDETDESTVFRTPERNEDVGITEEVDEPLYGKNKPRRETIRVKVIHD
jgi:hypothetical protein